MRTFYEDLRFGLRLMLKKPGFAAVALLTLALGIGANTAIFTVVNAVLLNPLPFADAGRMVALFETAGDEGRPDGGAQVRMMNDE